MFVRDITDGIADTGVKAGILKCATDEPGVTPGVERVLRAVAQAHRATGVPISTHTHARTRRGLEQQRIFAEEGVDLSRVVIGHSGDTTDLDYLEAVMARRLVPRHGPLRHRLLLAVRGARRRRWRPCARAATRTDGPVARRGVLQRLAPEGPDSHRHAELALPAHHARGGAGAARPVGSPTSRSPRCWSTTRAGSSSAPARIEACSHALTPRPPFPRKGEGGPSRRMRTAVPPLPTLGEGGRG